MKEHKSGEQEDGEEDFCDAELYEDVEAENALPYFYAFRTDIFSMRRPRQHNLCTIHAFNSVVGIPILNSLMDTCMMIKSYT